MRATITVPKGVGAAGSAYRANIFGPKGGHIEGVCTLEVFACRKNAVNREGNDGKRSVSTLVKPLAFGQIHQPRTSAEKKIHFEKVLGSVPFDLVNAVQEMRDIQKNKHKKVDKQKHKDTSEGENHPSISDLHSTSAFEEIIARHRKEPVVELVELLLKACVTLGQNGVRIRGGVHTPQKAANTSRKSTTTTENSAGQNSLFAPEGEAGESYVFFWDSLSREIYNLSSSMNAAEIGVVIKCIIKLCNAGVFPSEKPDEEGGFPDDPGVNRLSTIAKTSPFENIRPHDKSIGSIAGSEDRTPSFIVYRLLSQMTVRRNLVFSKFSCIYGLNGLAYFELQNRYDCTLILSHISHMIVRNIDSFQIDDLSRILNSVSLICPRLMNTNSRKVGRMKTTSQKIELNDPKIAEINHKLRNPPRLGPPSHHLPSDSSNANKGPQNQSTNMGIHQDMGENGTPPFQPREIPKTNNTLNLCPENGSLCNIRNEVVNPSSPTPGSLQKAKTGDFSHTPISNTSPPPLVRDVETSLRELVVEIKGKLPTAISQAKKVESSALYMICNALTRVGILDKDLFRFLSVYILEEIENFNQDSLTAIANAFAKFGHAESAGFLNLYKSLMKGILQNTHSISVRNFAVLTNALAQVSIQHQPFFHQISNTVGSQLVGKADARQISLLAHAYVKLGLLRDPLLHVVWQRVASVASSYNWQGISLVLQAFTKSGAEDGELVATLCELILCGLKANHRVLFQSDSEMIVTQSDLELSKGGRMRSKDEGIRKEGETYVIEKQEGTNESSTGGMGSRFEPTFKETIGFQGKSLADLHWWLSEERLFKLSLNSAGRKGSNPEPVLRREGPYSTLNKEKPLRKGKSLKRGGTTSKHIRHIYPLTLEMPDAMSVACIAYSMVKAGLWTNTDPIIFCYLIQACMERLDEMPGGAIANLCAAYGELLVDGRAAQARQTEALLLSRQRSTDILDNSTSADLDEKSFKIIHAKHLLRDYMCEKFFSRVYPKLLTKEMSIGQISKVVIGFGATMESSYAPGLARLISNRITHLQRLSYLPLTRMITALGQTKVFDDDLFEALTSAQVRKRRSHSGIPST